VVAQYNLGLLYFFGMGVKKDLKQSAYWIKMANNHGYKRAGEFWNKFELWKY